MKKYLILTSVLALAACGGGHHGGNGSPRSVLVSQDTIDSNKQLTNMATQILIAKDGTSQNIARPSSTAEYNGVEYEVHYLDEAEFKTAAFADKFDTINKSAVLTFTLDDDHKIVGMHVEDKSTWGDEGIVLKRDDDNKLSGGGTFKDDSNELKVEIKDSYYKSIAKGSDEADALTRDDLNLQYSDFGLLHANVHFIDEGMEDGEADLYFAGGYNSIPEKSVNMAEYNNRLEFTGRAIGDVSVDDGEGGAISLYTNDATLVFDNGKTNIEMPFHVLDGNGAVTDDKWYTVKAEINSTFDENNPNANVTDLRFTDGNNISAEYNAYRFDSNDVYVTDGNRLSDDCVAGQTPTIRDGFINYYGDNGTPTEAVGNMRYMEHENAVSNKSISFETSFGGKINPSQD